MQTVYFNMVQRFIFPSLSNLLWRTALSDIEHTHTNKKTAKVKTSVIYNNPNYSRTLIGSRLWSIRGQTHDWRHHYKEFPSVEIFENLGNILHDWAKDKIQKHL